MDVNCVEFLDTFFYDGEQTVFGFNHFEKDLIKPVSEMKNYQFLNAFERVGLNPMVIEATDKNVTSFRNIMVESDTLTPAEALYHIKQSKLPFSYIVFSGNKSLHFYICLERDIGSLEMYNYICRWVLRALGGDSDLVDKKTISPSRKARLSFGTNNKTGVIQKGRKIRDKIPNGELQSWLLANSDSKPIEYDRSFVKRSTEPNPLLLKQWVIHCLDGGIFQGKRNAFFYEAAINLAECGFDEYQAIEYLKSRSKNIIEGDFSEREMEQSVSSAFRRLLRENKL